MRLVLIFTFFSSIVTGQIDPFNENFSLGRQIYYYPFYNGQQLIEIDYFGESLERGRWGDIIHPRGGSDFADAVWFNIPNGFILRSITGDVIKTYGVNDLASIELSPPHAAITITHKERLNMSKVENYGQSTTWKDVNGYGYRFGEYRKAIQKEVASEGPLHSEYVLGIIDTLGNLMIEDASSISYADGEYLVTFEGKSAIYDSTFVKTMDYVDGTVNRAAPNKYFHIKDGTKIINRFGEKIDKDNYVMIDRARHEGEFIYSSRTISGVKCGIMRSDLSHLTPPIYASIHPLTKGYCVSNESQKWALLNENGERITEFDYQRDAIRWNQDGTYMVYQRDKVVKQGMIDSLGKVIIPIVYDQVEAFKNDLAVVSLNGKCGIVNRQGEVQGEIAYTKIMHVYKKHVHVNLAGKQGVISHTGEVILEPNYRSVSCFDSDFLFLSAIDNSRYIFNVNTKELNDCKYDQIWCFHNGFCKVAKDGKVGMIDTNLNVVIPLEYDFVSQFENGTVLVNKGKLYGLYNAEFMLVKPLKFKEYKMTDSGEYDVY